MRTLEEIKEEYATEKAFMHWSSFINSEPNYMVEKHMDEVSKRYALQVAQEALKNASENAEMVNSVQYTGGLGVTGLLYENTLVISKESILSETNIPELKTALICTKGIDELSKPRESILETYNKLKQSN